MLLSTLLVPTYSALVVSDSQIASDVGATIMRNGGNAVDAAVATGFALAVTLPAAGNIGGGGFMVIRLANGKTFALDYRETAPALASRNMYIGADGKPTRDSLVGYKAAGVPGTVAGFWEAHRKFGKLPWKDVVEPAVRLAEDGFKLPKGLSASLKSAAAAFKPFPTSYIQFCRNGRFYSEGELWRQLDLGATLRRVRDKGRHGFDTGTTADLIDKAMRNHGGLIRKDDLAGYKPVWRKPIIDLYHGHEIATMPPPSSGGIAMMQMFGMLERDSLSFGASQTIHLMTEAMKRAFADRAVHLGDPDFVSVPVASLLDPAYLAKRRSEISDRATPSESIQAFTGEPSREREETTHFSVVDKEGNAVANTYTLNGGYGSFATVEGAGFLLNNEMDDFASAPGTPNMYGLIQGEKNAIAPGKRPLSSMTPTIVSREGKLVLVLGSPGGPTIINTVTQTIMNSLIYRMPIQAAVDAPRLHHQWMPDELRWETGAISRDVRAELERKGHKIATAPRSQGSCHAIMVTSRGLEAGQDKRMSTAGSAGF